MRNSEEAQYGIFVSQIMKCDSFDCLIASPFALNRLGFLLFFIWL